MKSVIKITVNEKASNVNFFKTTMHWLTIFSILICLSHLAKYADEEIKKTNAHASISMNEEFTGTRSPAIGSNRE